MNWKNISRADTKSEVAESFSMAPFTKSLPAGMQDTINGAILITVLTGLYLTSLIDYLLFHSLAEIFSIVVASALFAKKYAMTVDSGKWWTPLSTYTPRRMSATVSVRTV